jgi:hypothetical protein
VVVFRLQGSGLPQIWRIVVGGGKGNFIPGTGPTPPEKSSKAGSRPGLSVPLQWPAGQGNPEADRPDLSRPAAELYMGWDEKNKGISWDRRVVLVVKNYVVAIRLN